MMTYMMQYSGKRPAQKSLLCEFRQKTAYKHIISSLRKVRHKELGPCLALLYLLLYVINNTHSIQVENFLQKIIPANKNTSIYATTEQNNQFSVSRNIDENHIIPINTIR